MSVSYCNIICQFFGMLAHEILSYSSIDGIYKYLMKARFPVAVLVNES